MTVRDIREVAPDVDVPVDVCVVGSGPAGMAIAHELAAVGRRVTVLESGGVADAGEAGDLGEIESVDAPRVMDQELVRVRGSGGTSRVWSGRLATFDETDFRERSWIPGSGWPLSRDDVGRYFAQAAMLLGGPVADNNARSKDHTQATEVLPAFDPAVFIRYFWTFSSAPGGRGDFLWFGRDLDGCRRSDIGFVVNATVTQLVPDPVQQRISAVEVSGPDLRIRRFVPDVVVLAAGGIENPSLLLASNRVHEAGIGNQHDQVGRYLMDHPRGPVASFTGVEGDRAARLLGNVQLAPITKLADRRTATVGVALSPELQEAEGLLNCSVWAVPQRSAKDPLWSLQKLLRRDPDSSALDDLRSVVEGTPVLAQGVVDTAVRGRSPRRVLDRLDIYSMVEQRPDPLSRITLSSRRDRLGVPLSCVDWKIGELEARTVRRAARLFAAEMTRLGHPVPELDLQIADESVPFHFPDIAHPTGTTRMSRDPRSGVVDENCRVHGLANLYVAGSSVFPTSGHANPTQMIVAMALRLADFVTRAHAPKPVSLRRDVAALSTPDVDVRPSAARVLVTGARGKVGRLLVTRLVETGYRVRALSSGPLESTEAASETAVQWVTCDLAAPGSFDDRLLDGVDAVVHLAAAQHGETVHALNVGSTVELVEACERTGVERFCFLSSASVYGSPRIFSRSTEDAPTLDERSAVERQYWTNPELRAYGSSKKAAEQAISGRSKGSCHCVVFRPTVIVDSIDVWSHRAAIRRGSALHPRALQLVHNEDVVSAILWALERKPAPDAGEARAAVEVFNLADNDASCSYESDVKVLLYGSGRGTARHLRAPLKVLYWLGSAARFYRGGALRLPLGLARYPNDRLLSEGFEFTQGMRSAWLGKSAEPVRFASSEAVHDQVR